MRTFVAKLFAKRDGVSNPKMIESYQADVEDLFTGIRTHIINPLIRIAKWIAVIFVIVNLLMLVFGESRLIDDWSVMDRLRHEWKMIRLHIDWHIL